MHSEQGTANGGACARARVPAGIFAAGVAAARQALDDGFTLVCAGVDTGLYAEAAAGLLRGLRPRNP